MKDSHFIIPRNSLGYNNDSVLEAVDPSRRGYVVAKFAMQRTADTFNNRTPRASTSNVRDAMLALAEAHNAGALQPPIPSELGEIIVSMSNGARRRGEEQKIWGATESQVELYEATFFNNITDLEAAQLAVIAALDAGSITTNPFEL